MKGKDSVRVPESKCLNCGYVLDAVGTGNKMIEAKPEPGDLTACIKCGAVMQLDKNLNLIGFTNTEIDELIANREFMNQIAKLVRKIHFVRHSIG